MVAGSHLQQKISQSAILRPNLPPGFIRPTEDTKISVGFYFYQDKTASAYLKDRIGLTSSFLVPARIFFCDLGLLSEMLLSPTIDCGSGCLDSFLVLSSNGLPVVGSGHIICWGMRERMECKDFSKSTQLARFLKQSQNRPDLLSREHL